MNEYLIGQTYRTAAGNYFTIETIEPKDEYDTIWFLVNWHTDNRKIRLSLDGIKCAGAEPVLNGRTSDRYVVSTRTYGAPKSNGGKFRRPVVVRVLDTTQSEWHAVRRLNDGVKLEIPNVDSRYDGPKSAYGRALEQAKELAVRLNAEDIRTPTNS